MSIFGPAVERPRGLGDFLFRAFSFSALRFKALCLGTLCLGYQCNHGYIAERPPLIRQISEFNNVGNHHPSRQYRLVKVGVNWLHQAIASRISAAKQKQNDQQRS